MGNGLIMSARLFPSMLGATNESSSDFLSHDHLMSMLDHVGAEYLQSTYKEMVLAESNKQAISTLAV